MQAVNLFEFWGITYCLARFAFGLRSVVLCSKSKCVQGTYFTNNGQT